MSGLKLLHIDLQAERSEAIDKLGEVSRMESSRVEYSSETGSVEIYRSHIDTIKREDGWFLMESLSRSCGRYCDPLRLMKLVYPSGCMCQKVKMEEDVPVVVVMRKYAALKHWIEICNSIRVA